ncbi:hypothetical protein B0J17DRAFT_703144 [Rhizoctonia solani]|nr:hypothetical protein B0J17DRAFT_703144 [Rhizoctonia solani]
MYSIAGETLLRKVPVDSSKIDAYVSRPCSLIATSSHFLQLSLRFYHHRDMPKSLANRRKGRSRLQKVHDHQRSAIGQFAPTTKPDVTNSSDSVYCPLAHDGSITLSLPTPGVIDKNVVIKSMNKRYDLLNKHLKNTLQREKRAKHKVEHLQDVVNHAYTQLRKEATHSANQVCQSQQHILALKERMKQDSKKLISQATEIESQQNLFLNLKERHASMLCKRDALRKQFVHQNKQLTNTKQVLGHVDNSICNYNLKEDAGVIRLEVRDMIRKLACQGVSTKRVTEIIRIVGETLGMEIIGLVSAHSVARIMLEGLVQAQMQIAQELNQANCENILSLVNLTLQTNSNGVPRHDNLQ